MRQKGIDVAKTFLELTNDILLQFNEVLLTKDNFDNYRGVQSVAKSAVNKSIAKINHSRYQWPFNAAEHTLELQQNVSEYAWPLDFKVADWQSFQIQQSILFGNDYSSLKPIDKNEWYRVLRNSDSLGGGIPRMVFETHGNGFGLSPRPDKNYNLKFRYYQTTKDLVKYDDETNIPDEYSYVIFTGAMSQMLMFKSDLDQANVADQMFNKYLANMGTILLNQTDAIRDTRVR